MCLLEDGPNEGRVIGSSIEILDHSRLRDLRNVVPHCLESLEERAEGLVALELDGIDVPRLRRFVGERLEIRDKPMAEVFPFVDEVSWSHCNTSCPMTMGRYTVMTSSVAQ